MNRVKRLRLGRCQVCKHPDRLRIELHRLSGGTLDAVAAKFGVQRDALHRHMKGHLDEEDKKALIDDIPMRELAARAAQEGGSVLDYLGIVRNVVMRQLLGAAEACDRSGTAALANRAVEVLQALGKISGEISSLAHVTNIQNNVAVFSAPAFAELESMLVQRLAGHPAALREVIEGLRELEDRAEGLAPGQARPPIAVIEARPS